MHSATSNLDAIASARENVAEAQQAIRALAHDGGMPGDAMVARCAEILDAALEPAFAFIPREKWELSYSRPASDIVDEVAGYVQ